ncbi:hypothetical protein EJ06DRAFT_552562 [Trichodelitschia bisporula]|uniref:SWIM-type domain-containing protein n=1 Tax=Trichodelitschia bisporula TaxID=703511 RepID=A0A6G1IAW2_9PEZI|nr:hypothetical protein EJ06DRAFT_552562 [Trichodelitschia bisporula]
MAPTTRAMESSGRRRPQVISRGVEDELPPLTYSIDTGRDESAVTVADAGFKGTYISFKNVKKMDGAHLHFQLSLRESVYVDILEDLEGKWLLECSCGNDAAGKACTHKYWTWDQLTRSYLADNPRRNPELLIDDKCTQVSLRRSSRSEQITPNKVIRNPRGVDKFADDIQYRQAPTRTEVKKYLTVFLPLEQDEEDDSISDAALLNVITFIDEYEGADAEFASNLRSILSPSVRAEIRFEKVRKGAEKSFHALDEYILRGPNASSCDEQACARRIQGYLEALRREYESRRRNLKLGAGRVAASTLLYILNGIIIRRNDAVYGERSRHPIMYPGNLYSVLIQNSDPRDVTPIDIILLLDPGHFTDTNSEELGRLWQVVQSLDAPPDFEENFLSALRRFC